MKKRLLAGMLCLSMAVAASACGNKNSSDADSTQGNDGKYPAFPNYSAGLTDEGYIDGVTATDYITLEYKGIEMDADEVTVTDKDFDEYVTALLEEYAEEVKVTDRGVEDDDIVSIDFVGKVDGKEFEGGSAKDYSVRIGVTQFIDDFIEQLKGHEIGETFDIEVTFPKEYSNSPDLAGKDATFTITINSISEMVAPECDDAFVEKNFPDYEDAEDFLAKEREAYELTIKMNAVWGILLEEAEIKSYPEKFKEAYYQEQLNYYDYMAFAYESTLDELLASSGTTKEEFLKVLGESVDNDVKEMLIVQAICEGENIKIEDGDLKKYIGYDEANAQTIISMYGKGYLYQQILKQKAAECVVGYATVEE